MIVRGTNASCKSFSWNGLSKTMPELPEVETTVRMLRPMLMGRSIIGMENNWPRHIVTPEVRQFRERIFRHQIQSIHRRGKYIIFTLDHDEFLLIHLKMTGHLSIADVSEPPDPYVHTTFILDDGDQLRFKDVRKFGRVYLVNNTDEILGRLGPEPLDSDFTGETLHGMLRGRNRILKPLLLDQTFIAGLGNIYTDEALHDAAIHPSRMAKSLTKNESHDLHQSIRSILLTAIRRNGSSVGNFRKPDGTPGEMQNALKVYGQAGADCHRCGSPIERMILGGRGTHYCANCQM
jgi:formamidopyrimidine-DNA glycosylase